MVKELETGLGTRPSLRRQMAGGVRLRCRSFPEKALDQPVLERMERDDDKASLRGQHALGCGEAPRQLGKLVVDVDAQRLEGARRRVTACDPGTPQHACGEFGQLRRADYGLLLPPRHDGAS